MKTTKIINQTKVNNKSVSKTAKNKTTDNTENEDFPIVGIGTSAGGLETLDQFFSKMPFAPKSSSKSHVFWGSLFMLIFLY